MSIRTTQLRMELMDLKLHCDRITALLEEARAVANTMRREGGTYFTFPWEIDVREGRPLTGTERTTT